MTSYNIAEPPRKRKALALLALEKKYGGGGASGAATPGAAPTPTASDGPGSTLTSDDRDRNSGQAAAARGAAARATPTPVRTLKHGVSVLESPLPFIRIPACLTCAASTATPAALPAAAAAAAAVPREGEGDLVVGEGEGAPPLEDRAASGAGASVSDRPGVDWWCSFKVALEDIDWAAYRESLGSSHGAAAPPPPLLPSGLSFFVVDSEESARSGVSLLRLSMRDPLLALDLEWPPEGMHGVRPGTSKVAMLQISSGSLCLLVRPCRTGHRLPRAIEELLDDDTNVFLGFSWFSADEKMFQRTFGRGWRDFGGKGQGGRCFLDLQDVAVRFGYARPGLSSLCLRVLGLEPPKSRRVAMSDWGSRHLTPQQMMYAALDGLLTGAVFRALRHWHHSEPHPCPRCHQALGWGVMQSRGAGAGAGGAGGAACSCGDCGRRFESGAALDSHRAASHSKGQVGGVTGVKAQAQGQRVCEGCGRFQQAVAAAAAAEVVGHVAGLQLQVAGLTAAVVTVSDTVSGQGVGGVGLEDAEGVSLSAGGREAKRRRQ